MECDLCKHERREEFEDLLAQGRMNPSEVASLINSKPGIVLHHMKEHSGKKIEKRWPVKLKEGVRKNN